MLALGLALFVLAPSCGDDDGTTDTDNCGCLATQPVCGIDGMSYDAGCGVQCVPVQIVCMSQCPCGSTTDPTAADTSGSATTDPGSTTVSTTAEASTGADTSSSGGEPPACDGVFPPAWIDGSACGEEPLVQVHYYDPDTAILRQSLCTSFEGPFLYMLFGEDQVLLEDTGDGGIPIDDVVYGIIDEWLAAHGRASIELLVVNSHAHGDHVQGNPLFEGQPDTTVIDPNVASLSRYFGIGTWPTEIVQHDLGGRVIDVIPIPGHQTSHIALLDHQTGLLLTGDTLYPGRLYIDDFPAYVASIERLVAHVAGQTLCHVMGTHIEMTQTPGVDFPFGAPVHLDEHPLALGVDHLVELRDAVVAMGDTPVYEAHDDFIVYPL
jgi:hydroxyacylglutathione hydrolase